jgi:hypothetical protein
MFDEPDGVIAEVFGELGLLKISLRWHDAEPSTAG